MQQHVTLKTRLQASAMAVLILFTVLILPGTAQANASPPSSSTLPSSNSNHYGKPQPPPRHVPTITPPRITSVSTQAPISINGNADFAAQAASNGWPGNGSASNPYIIENLVIITDLNYTHAIAIRNTTVHFIIRNCTVSATGAGDWWPLENQTSGIYLYNVTNGVLMNNVAYSSTKHGFFLLSASNITLINNIAYRNNRAGFHLDSSSNITLINNTAHHNGRDGFTLFYYSSSNVLINNTAHDNGHGFRLELFSNNNKFINNIARNNRYGFFLLYFISGNTFRHNIVYNNTGLGLYVDQECGGNVVMYNDFVNNGGRSQAYSDGGSNVFDYNYWSDYTSPDLNGDGIVDVPYSVDGYEKAKDQHPVTTPYHPEVVGSGAPPGVQDMALVLLFGSIVVILGTVGLRWWRRRHRGAARGEDLEHPRG